MDRVGHSLATRIRDLRRELAELEQQQHDDLLRAIATVYASEVFTASTLWQQDDLRQQFEEAGIRSPQQLGLWLKQVGFDRICRDNAGIVWGVSAADLHHDAGVPIDDDV